MTFKDLKPNYPIYILNKEDLTVTQGKTLSVSQPRVEINPKTSKMETLVDVSIEINGYTRPYAIPDDLVVTYAGNLVLATDKGSLICEVEAMKNAAEQILASVDKQKEILEKSQKLLGDLNPALKEKQETEARFTQIEDRFSKVEDTMGEMKDMMKTLLKEFKS